MSRHQAERRRTLGTFALTVLAATIGNTAASAEWQETVSDSGNYSVLMPGAGNLSSKVQPTPFGNSREHYCETMLTSPDKEFVTTIRVCSAHEPEKFLAKYTAQERIELINKMFVAFHKSKLPDYGHTLETKPAEILGRPAERLQSTFRRGNDWSVNHSAMVYIDDVRYHIQVTQHGKGTGAILSEEEIEKIFSSFSLLNETGVTNSEQALALGMFKQDEARNGNEIDVSGQWRSDRICFELSQSTSGQVSGRFGRPNWTLVGQVSGHIRGGKIMLEFHTPGGHGDFEWQLHGTSEATVRWRKAPSTSTGWSGQYSVARLPSVEPEAPESKLTNQKSPHLHDHNILSQAIGYYSGDSGKIDHAAARKLFTKAVESNDPLAHLWMATLLYRADCGFDQDKRRAQELTEGSIDDIKRLANEGNVEAMFLFANALVEGLAIEEDIPAAFQWYRKAAEQGLATAQHNLGCLYEYGTGVRLDLTRAAEWYRRAAEQGFAMAQYNLGCLYTDGTAVGKDLTKAAEWYRKAADQGLANAQYNLGLCYQKGDGLEQDSSQATDWYRKAADQGYASAQYNLGLCYQNGIGVQPDQTQAATWYREAAEQGHVGAQNNLGKQFYDGNGVPQDWAEAARLWELAAAQGSEVATRNLAMLSSSRSAPGFQPPNSSQQLNHEQRRNEQERKFWQQRNENQINEQRRAAAQYQAQAQGQ